MELTKLLQGVEATEITGQTRREIQGIAYHSGQVQRGFLFAAIRGLRSDGHHFIEDAIRKGAEAVVVEEEQKVSGATMILVPSSRKALAKISANFYGDPSSRITLVGVTGTNGKTTTVYLLESILKKAGYAVGVIGTINYRYGQTFIPAPNTTPESLDLQRILAEMVRAGTTHVIMEVSSHSLDLDRVHGCQFDGAIFTNLTTDHLDYHPSMDHYFEAKKRLFSDYLARSPKPARFAVINQDDARSKAISEGLNLPAYRYGLSASCPVSVQEVRSTFEGLSCKIRTPKGSFRVQSKLIGSFNLYNLMASVGAGIAMSIPLEILREGIESLAGVPGRLERVENGRGMYIFVDYAHTPDALERSLSGLGSILDEQRLLRKTGKMVALFGCGGDRDRTKRPLMGKAAGGRADLVILTSDNPRTEDPLVILGEVEAGIKGANFQRWTPDTIRAWRTEKGYIKIPDRREAIRMAVQVSQPSDVVLIAGKGHEDYQIVGTKKLPFDDRIEVKRALEGL